MSGRVLMKSGIVLFPLIFCFRNRQSLSHGMHQGHLTREQDDVVDAHRDKEPAHDEIWDEDRLIRDFIFKLNSEHQKQDENQDTDFQPRVRDRVIRERDHERIEFGIACFECEGGRDHIEEHREA